MHRTSVAVTLGILFLVVGVPAQPRDPISGTWTSDGRPMLDLQLAGTRVSGTVFLQQGGKQVGTAPIERGSFDPRTATVRVSGTAQPPGGAPRVEFVIEGTLEGNDTLQVAYAFGPTKGTMVMRRMALQAAEAASRPGTVLVTGANRGLGFEFAKQYAARGWKVIATARDPQAARELQQIAKSGTLMIEKLDLLDIAAIKALAGRYRGTPVDIVINNAGVLGDIKAQTRGSFDAAEFDEVMRVNVYGALAVAEAFREHVAASQHKKIVSITSGSGIISLPGSRGPYFYRASKVALNMVMRVLADDLRNRGVIVAMVAPGVANTDMRRQLVGAAADRDPPPQQAVAAMIKVIDRLTLDDTGKPFNFDGAVMPW